MRIEIKQKNKKLAGKLKRYGVFLRKTIKHITETKKLNTGRFWVHYEGL